MTIESSKRDLMSLLLDEPVSRKVVLRVLHEHHLLTQEEIDYANLLLPDAGDYLPPWWIRKFIRAEISDHEAQEKIASQRSLVERIRELFPAVVQHLKISDPVRAQMTLSIVFDACTDYPTILASGQREANRRKIIQRMIRLQQQVARLGVFLEDGDATRDYGFDKAYRLYMKHVHNSEEEARPFWN